MALKFKCYIIDGTYIDNASIVDVVGQHIAGNLDFAVTELVNDEHYMIHGLDKSIEPNATEGTGLYLYKHNHATNSYYDFKYLGK